jgi:hypothetical protein
MLLILGGSPFLNRDEGTFLFVISSFNLLKYVLITHRGFSFIKRVGDVVFNNTNFIIFLMKTSVLSL